MNKKKPPIDKRFLNLLEQLKQIDEEAVSWILNEGVKLSSFKESNSLQNVFCWCDTPQGSYYWKQLNEELKKLTKGAKNEN